MSAPMYPPPPSPAARSERRSVASMIIGWILIVFGFFTTVAGVALLVLFGSGAALTSNVQTFSSSTPALVADLGTIDDASRWTRWSGAPTLVINAPAAGGTTSFIGVARTEDVDRYLTGVARDQVTDFDLSPFQLTVRRVEGTDAATPPAAQTFWVAEMESGQATEFSWAFADGNYSIVVMNADGSAGVNAPVSVGISIPNSTGLWIIVIVVGGVLLLGGIALVVFGSRRVQQPQYAQPYPQQYPPPQYPPQP